MSKITDLDPSNLVSGDVLLTIVDLNDTSMDDSGTNKKITLANLASSMYNGGFVERPTVISTIATNTYTITSADFNKYIRFTSGTGTAIILNGADTNWDDGMTVALRRDITAGPLTLGVISATVNGGVFIGDILAGQTCLLKCIDTSNPTNIIFDFI